VRVNIGVGVKVGTSVWVAVGDGVDDAVAVAVAEAVGVRVGLVVRVGVVVPFDVGVIVADGLGVGVHGAANVAKMSARIGMKSRSVSAIPRKASAPLHPGNRVASADTMIAAQKSAAVLRPSQFASARSGSGVDVGMEVCVGVAGAVGVNVGVAVDVSVGACTGVLWAAAAQLRKHAARNNRHDEHRVVGVADLA